MDGKNSSGRRVSLLNDSIEAPHLIRLPSISPSLRSRTSSYTSSPIGSPPTPRLIRSDSADSISMQTPSPITPEFAFDAMSHGLPSPNFPPPQYFDMPHNAMQHDKFYTQQPVAMPYPTQPPAFYRQQPVMTGAEQLIASPAPAPSSVRQKKNSYPCPMAKQFQCSDYFTTSGHAARHAKKHTGKKDAYCPECNKAFTRKDNMEQHRRTHQSGRGAKGSDTGVKKAKPAAKRPRPSPLQSSAPSMSLSNLDPSLSASPDAMSFMAPVVQQAEPHIDYPVMQQRSSYPDPTNFAVGYSSGLDALAIAATGEKRKWNS